MQEVTSFGIKANSSASCDESFLGVPLGQYRGSACWYLSKHHWLNTEADSVILGVDHAYTGRKKYNPQTCRVQHALTGELANVTFPGKTLVFRHSQDTLPATQLALVDSVHMILRRCMYILHL